MSSATRLHSADRWYRPLKMLPVSDRYSEMNRLSANRGVDRHFSRLSRISMKHKIGFVATVVLLAAVSKEYRNEGGNYAMWRSQNWTLSSAHNRFPITSSFNVSECFFQCDTNVGYKKVHASLFKVMQPVGCCLARCRWLYRQTVKSERRWRKHVGRTSYESLLTTASPLLEGLCHETSAELDGGVCSAVAHRQKSNVTLVVSDSSWLSQEMNFGIRDCAVSRCTVVPGTGHSLYSDLYIGTTPVGAIKRRKDQKNVFVQMEPVDVHDLKEVDYVASHRFHDSKSSWIPLSYLNSDEVLFRIKGKGHHERRLPIPVLISHCGAESGRDSVVSELGKYLEIEQMSLCDLNQTRKTTVEQAFPQCKNLPRRSAMWDAQKECIFFHSLFALVLENTHQLNYVTEKLWQALKVGAVPIVAGDPTLYRHVLPSPDAAIFLEDFSDYAAAASYIRNLMRSAKAWEKHVQWKNRVFSDNFVFLLHHSFATLACDLCDKYSVGETDPRHAILQNMDPCVLDLLSQHNIPDISTGDSALEFDAVFVVHYTPLVQRRQDILNTVKNQFGIEPVFVEAFDREALTAEHLACIGDRYAQRAFISRNTTQGEDSLSLKHMAVYFYMVQHSLQNVLILEDDATFLQSDWKSPQSLWQHILKVLPADYDMLFLSGCCKLHNIGTKISEHLYLAQSSRVSSMYLISQKGARNMLRSLPLVAPIDFQMNYAAGWKDQWLEKMPRFHGPRTIDIKLYHTEPYMSEQSNKYRSALSGELGLGLKNRGAGV